MKDLVIVVDEEAKNSQGWRNLPREWFRGINGTEGIYRLETPLGDTRTVRGTLLDTFDLSYMTSEFFYLDVTNACNYRCKHCGVKGDIKMVKIGKEPVCSGAKYITDNFTEAVANAISKYPKELLGGHRKLFYGGGEPLINPARFSEINQAFDKVENTTRYITTNSLSLPIQEEEFIDFVDQIGRPYLLPTYSKSHAEQFASLARTRRDLSKWIPDVEPDLALKEKVKIQDNICKDHGLDYKINVVTRNGSPVPLELRSLVLNRALRHFQTFIDYSKKPCFENQETAIRFNGDLYPHCSDVFIERNKLGVIGFLR